jgi:Transcriptional regulatory protein, C terminal/GAF domain
MASGGIAVRAPMRDGIPAESTTRRVQPAVALLRTLDTVAARLSAPRTIRDVAALVGTTAMAALDADATTVLIRTRERRRLVRAYDAGLSDAAQRYVARVEMESSGVLAQAARHGRPLYLHGLREASQHGRSNLAELADIGDSLAAVPILWNKRLLGLLVVGWCSTLTFPVETRAFLGVLGTQCGLALAIEARRRGAGQDVAPVGSNDLRLDARHQRVLIGGRPVRLTSSEFRLLSLLAEDPGRPRTRHEIVRHLWESEPVGSERICDTHVRNLRVKIERDPSRPARLVTVRGIGYALRPD